MVLRTALAMSFVMVSAVQAADFPICWTGANGYTMTGTMRVDPAALKKDILTERDVVSFKIAGYHKGRLLGTWDLNALDENSTWHLRFDVQSRTFLTGGSFPTTRSQGWNANGGVQNCGNPGFGFNAGNYAQDVCVNGNWISDSSIPPDTALVAQPCEGDMFLSKARKNESFDLTANH